ncbi:hypothetical protein [Micromonospora sp. NPDC126480]|uniref:hypothetical protein n=1 Tax=Micromonospora sp. NPDC126480 TaxID=3155312 RepID=UPI003317DB1E
MSEDAQRRDPDRSGGGPTGWRVSAEPARREHGTAGSGGGAEPDVLLDVPEVSVDSIRLAVDSLDADLSLRARLANLLQLDAGVRVHLQGVELDITGVHAEALLKVRLEKLVEILDRALSTIDRNPQIIEALARTTTNSIDDVNRAAPQAEQLSVAAQRITDATAEGVRARPRTGATDELGQQVGAMVDRGQGRAGGAGGPGGGRERGGQGRPGERGTGLASGAGGGGEFGAAERARGRAEEMGGPGGSAEEGRAGGQPEEAPAKAGGAGGRPEEAPAKAGGAGGRPGEGPAEEGRAGGRPEAGARSDAGPKEEAGEAPGEGPPSALQLAEQAGETLRQAGRSVWEAIQGGIAARRDADR